MKYKTNKTKVPSWNEILCIIKRYFLLIILLFVSIILLTFTGVFYIAAFQTNLSSEGALKLLFENIIFDINWGMITITLILLFFTLLTLHAMLFTALSLGSNQKYTPHIRWRVTWLGIGITVIFISTSVWTDGQFSTLVGILSVLALSLQIPNFLSVDKKND